MKKIKEKFLTIYIILNILYIFVSSYLNTLLIFSQEKITYGFIVILILNVIISLILIIKKKYKKNLIDLFIILIAIFGVIATIFAYKQDVSLFGEKERFEGLFTILYYLSLFFVTSFVNKKDKKIIIYTIIITGLVQAVYAIFQIFELPHIKVYYHLNSPWASGFLYNPNFFGIYMLLCLSYLIGLFIEEKNRYLSIIQALLIIMFMIGLLISNTLSVLVGLMVVMTITAIYIIKNKKYKRFVVCLVIILSTLFILHNNGMTKLVHDLNVTKKETISMANGTAKSTYDYGTGRVYIWQQTLKVVPKYFWHGIGIDNFKYIMNGKSIVRRGFHYDKAHNELLQILVTQGIFSFISYTCFYFLIIKNSVKNSFKNKEIYLLLPVIGYIVQGMFNISVILVAPIFYIAMGLTIDRENS